MLKTTAHCHSLAELRNGLGAGWPHILAARAKTDLAAARLSSVPQPVSEDASLVVFGSFARNEQTSKSDLDWTLLIDGQATSDHLTLAQELKESQLTASELSWD
jgi:predicted nucleotidyltransferase